MILKEQMLLVDQVQLAPRIFAMTLQGDMVQDMKMGQFIHIRVPDDSMLLRRPISISEIDRNKSQCRIIYRVEGQGTEVFSKMTVGQYLDVMGPLGKGFEVDFLKEGDRILIIGGGIGVPPWWKWRNRRRTVAPMSRQSLALPLKRPSFWKKNWQVVGWSMSQRMMVPMGVRGMSQRSLKS